MSGSCLKRVWKVPGRCLEGPDLTCFAQFESRRYWVVFECCQDIMEGVWNVHLRCLESTCKVSDGCLKGVWRVSGICLKNVWMVSERQRLDKIGQIWPLKIFGSV